jgi:hypothetical protein
MLVVMTINGGRFGGLGAALVVVLGVGCGDSGGGTESMSASDSKGDGSSTVEPTGGPTEASGSISMSATEGNEGGMSESLSGTTNAEGGVSDSMTNSGGSGNESISGSGSTGDETGMISGGGETSNSTGSESTGSPIDCSEILEEEACIQAGCLAVKGNHFVSDNAIWCLEVEPVFLGCMAQMGCDDVLTTVCKGDVKYQLPNNCIPEGFTECNPPPDQGGNGYPPCE